MIKAKQAFDSKGWTQEYLAVEAGLSSRQSVWKFFTGKPIERYVFKEICFKLDLDWEEIADLPPDTFLAEGLGLDETLGLDGWVKVVRSQLYHHIETQCNTLQSSFDLTQPLLSQIYTLVNILPQPSHQRWLEVSDLQGSQFTSDRLHLSTNEQEAVPGIGIIVKHNKLMLLGKPGAGKTTFLQYIALQCNQGKYRSDLIPFFMQLRSLTSEFIDEEESDLFNYFIQECKNLGLSQEQAIILLQEGRFLVLLDGLDEVSQEETDKLLKQIDQFAQEYYKNQIIITCRSASQNYHFRGFTYVEIADFKQEQIESFARQWFVATAKDPAQGLLKAEQFIEQLEHPENQPIRELGITPILLNLICSVFRERSSFPTKRAKLYQAALDILLKRWDQARGIQRDQVYRHLSLPEKIKLLYQIAATTFEQGNYFFETSEIIYIIEDYLQNYLNSTTDSEVLWLDSEAVLKAIELQHGLLVERARDIYSFSHLTFQEYLTARKIIASHSYLLERELEKIATYITDSRWREVILLTVSMLPKGDFLLQKMKEKVDVLGKSDPTLKQFLTIIEQKVSSMELPYRKAAVRAFYFTLFQNRDLNLAVSLDVKLASMKDSSKDLSLDSTLARTLTDSLQLVHNPEIKKFFNLCFSLDLEGKFKLEPSFQKALQTLKAELPSPGESKEFLKDWWQNHGHNWLVQFRHILIEHRQIGHDWQLNSQQQQLWQQYYNANLFLVESLNSDCQVSPEVREKIEATLLLLD